MLNIYWLVASEEHADSQEIENKYYTHYKEAFLARGLVFQFVSLNSIMVAHTNEGIELLWNTVPFDIEKSAFIITPANINSQMRAFAFALRNYLKAAGAVLLNQSICGLETMEWDKGAQMAFAARQEAPVMPFSMIAHHHQLIPTVNRFINNGYDSLIFKPVGSGMGFGIIKTDSYQQAIGVGELISSSSVGYLVMPFLQGACDLRFYFIEGKLMFVQFRNPQKGGYLGNISLGAKQEIFSETEYISNFCEENAMHARMFDLSYSLLKHSNSEILSVDWLVNRDTFFFNEICTVETGLMCLPEDINSCVFDRLSSFIKKKINS